MKKQDIEFDPNNVELFRVSLISKDNKAKPNLRGNIQDIETISF